MCELKPIPFTVFLLPKKATSRKSELIEQPKLKKGDLSKIHFEKRFIVKFLISTL